MKFTERVYHVVDISDFLNHIIATDKNFVGDSVESLYDRISESSEVTFGDAIDTIVTAQSICDILECEMPQGVDQDMLIGLGS